MSERTAGGKSPRSYIGWVSVKTQVQLLISAQDVENYKLIKADLDRLRTLVEKSELWVEKKSSGGGDGKKDKKDKKEKSEVRRSNVFNKCRTCFTYNLNPSFVKHEYTI